MQLNLASTTQYRLDGDGDVNRDAHRGDEADSRDMLEAGDGRDAVDAVELHVLGCRLTY